MHAQLKQCISLNTLYYAHVDMHTMISQTIKLIVSSYDFICSDIVVDCNNYSSVYLM